MNSENKYKTVISKFHIRLLKHLNPNPNPKFDHFDVPLHESNHLNGRFRPFLEIMLPVIS